MNIVGCLDFISRKCYQGWELWICSATYPSLASTGNRPSRPISEHSCQRSSTAWWYPTSSSLQSSTTPDRSKARATSPSSSTDSRWAHTSSAIISLRSHCCAKCPSQRPWEHTWQTNWSHALGRMAIARWVSGSRRKCRCRSAREISCVRLRSIGRRQEALNSAIFMHKMRCALIWPNFI